MKHLHLRKDGLQKKHRLQHKVVVKKMHHPLKITYHSRTNLQQLMLCIRLWLLCIEYYIASPSGCHSQSSRCQYKHSRQRRHPIPRIIWNSMRHLLLRINDRRRKHLFRHRGANSMKHPRLQTIYLRKKHPLLHRDAG